MTPERWKQVEQIFFTAEELPDLERGSYLMVACSNDLELRQEVESLLEQDPETRTILKTLISQAAGSLSLEKISDLSGKRIGPYRTIGLIGEGGMAQVYKAVRDDDQYQKQVAIKIIQHGFSPSFMIGRFWHERQILANLEHPCIARFLEGGTTQDGISYLVMEYIEGVPITDFCVQHNLTIQKRLELFRSVCEAVQYAHRNLVIHRDLKPSNILVTASDATPKLLDFGIAKLLNQQLSNAPDLTQTAASIIMMTPDYASPEQVRGEPVTTSTDIYSLGAILYEMVTGQRPHQFKSRSWTDIQRVVCEQDPEKPSSVVIRNIADADRTQIGSRTRLSRELARDVDNMVMMAMQKEPRRRYQTAEQFAEDIDKYLQGQPIRARTPTIAYRATKFVGRHRVGVAISAAVLTLIVLFIAGILRERSRAEEARKIAEREAARSRAVNEFLLTTLGSANPFGEHGRDITLIEALKTSAKDIEKSFKNEPETEADVRNTIGHTFLQLNYYDDAEKQLMRALEIRKKLHSSDHADVAESLDNMGTLFKEKGDLVNAESSFRQALAMRERLYGKYHAAVGDSMNNLGATLQDWGNLKEAEKFYREALEIRMKVSGPESDDVASSLNDLGIVLLAKRDNAGAEAMLRRALDLDRKRYGEDHPNYVTSLNNLAYVLERSNLAEAEKIYRKVLEMNTRLLGEEHQHTTITLNNIGRVLIKEGNAKSAEPFLRRAIEIQKRTLPAGHAQIAKNSSDLGQALLMQNRCNEAEPLLREALAIFSGSNPSSNPDETRKAIAQSRLGSCLTMMKRYPEAEKMLVDANSALLANIGAEHPETKLAKDRLNHLYQYWKN